MLSFFNSKPKLKGFRVCKNKERLKKYGIAADTLEVLVNKVKEKFEIEKFHLFFDKAMICDEDYFNLIPNQAIIVVVEDGEIYKTGSYFGS
jgi:DNA fragmentation factor beta subunit